MNSYVKTWHDQLYYPIACNTNLSKLYLWITMIFICTWKYSVGEQEKIINWNLEVQTEQEKKNHFHNRIIK